MNLLTQMCKQNIALKSTPFGQDMLDVLADNQLKGVGFRELDVSKAIITLKSYLVKKLTPKGGEYPSQLRFLYPVYFDSARVLLAECVSEFFQTGKVSVSELDTNLWMYTDHEIYRIIVAEFDVNTLLRVLLKVQNPNHDLCSRWQDPADRARWRRHIQEQYDVLRQLK